MTDTIDGKPWPGVVAVTQALCSQGPTVTVAYAGWTSWTLHLVWTLIRIPRVGYAVCDGIPVSVIGWGILRVSELLRCL
jgi:hypothetical protein